jgi:hypothetical protein
MDKIKIVLIIIAYLVQSKDFTRTHNFRRVEVDNQFVNNG